MKCSVKMKGQASHSAIALAPVALRAEAVGLGFRCSFLLFLLSLPLWKLLAQKDMSKASAMQLSASGTTKTHRSYSRGLTALCLITTP